MAQTQAQIQPFLSRMLESERITLGADQQDLLAAWATMTALNLQFTIPKQDQQVVAIGHPYFAHLYTTQSAPPTSTSGSPLAMRELRIALISSTWGFVCQCCFCTQHGTQWSGGSISS
jgi:hypothetical protein